MSQAMQTQRNMGQTFAEFILGRDWNFCAEYVHIEARVS